MSLNTNSTLALRYRPKRLEDLAGHESIVGTLRGLFKKGSCPNAFMIVGPSGVGKTTIARMISRYFNCETDNACGKCKSCLDMDTMSNMDYKEVNAAEAGNKDDVRAIIEAAQFKPRNKLRIFFLDEVHKMGTHGVNALLKILEEPPQSTLFILATTNPESIPNTKAVCGRCTPLILDPPSREAIADRLMVVAKAEKISWMNDKAGLAIGEASGGHVRDALQILESTNNYIEGLDEPPSRRELRTIIGRLSVQTVDRSMDKLGLALLAGLYTFKPKMVQEAIMGTDDHLGLINKALYLNYYVLSKVLVGSHEKLWDTQMNKAAMAYLKGQGAKMTAEDVIVINQALTNLRSEMQSFTVDAKFLTSARLLPVALGD